MRSRSLLNQGGRRGGRALVKGLAIVAIAVTLAVSAEGVGLIGTARAAQAKPNIICCGSFFSGVVTWANATNASINFTTAFAPTTPVSVEFGNATSGEIFSQNQTEYDPTTLKGMIFLNYLQPSNYSYYTTQITYDFKLVAEGGGKCIHGSVEFYCWQDGSFNTTDEPTQNGYVMQGISGNVALSTGGHPPSGINVIASCPPILDYPNGALGLTSTNGNFQISVQATQSLLNTCGAYPLTVYVYPATTSGWIGYWNETIMIFAPQDTISFDLPANQVGPWLPMQLEYTNSSYATLSFTQSDSITTTYTATVAGNGQQGSSTFTVSESGSSKGQNNEVWVKYYYSGALNWSAITRKATDSGLLFYGAIQKSSTVNYLNDTLSPSSITASEAFGNGLWYNYTITPGHTRGGNATVTGTVTDIRGFQGDISVSVGIGSGVDVGVTIPIDATFSTTNSYSNTLSFSIDNKGSGDHGFRVYIEGGSNTTSGLILHVWQLY